MILHNLIIIKPCYHLSIFIFSNLERPNIEKSKLLIMKKLSFSLIIGYILIGTLGFSQINQDEKILAGMHSISSHDLNNIVIELASEKYGGRLTGSETYKLAANYLADYLKAHGIMPKGDNNTYFQEFNIPYTEVFEGCSLTLHIPLKKGEIQKHYQYVKEFIPGATSASGEVSGEVVYAGYGITAPELGYDDYKDVDVKGKIILIEREIPMSPRDDQERFIKWAPYSYHQYKLENAVAHGAIGMIYNYGPISNPNNAYAEGFIYSHVGDSVVADIFEGTGYTHAETTKKIAETLKPHSFKTGKTVTIKNITKYHPDGIGSNIIGFIEGNDSSLKDEVIILGAHMDHLGYCYEMMPGANDNASGVAVIMEVARALKEYDIQLKRSILILSFGAEEQGIIGSKAYLENPVVPLNKTVGLINLDGVGVGDKISATAGLNFPELYQPLADANDKYVHRVMRANEFLNISRPRLDAARFMSAGIPIVSFGAYGKGNEGPSVYHQPGDDIDKITPEIMEDLAQIIFVGIIELANK